MREDLRCAEAIRWSATFIPNSRRPPIAFLSILPTSARCATLSSAIISTVRICRCVVLHLFSLRFASVSKRRSAALQPKHRRHFILHVQINAIDYYYYCIRYRTIPHQSAISQLRCYAGYSDFSFIFIFIRVAARALVFT